MAFPSPTSHSSSGYPAPIHLRLQPLPSIPPLLSSPRTLPSLLPTLRLARPHLLPPLPVAPSGSSSIVTADGDDELPSGGSGDDELHSGGGGDDELPSGGDGDSGGAGGDDGDGGGGEDGNGDGDGDDASGNRSEALFVLAQLGRKLESLPADLAAAVEGGRVNGDIVRRYVDLEASPLFSWLMQFGGVKERLLADDLFLTKVGIECGMGVFTKAAAEYKKRRENFVNELDFVLTNVIMAVVADFMLAWLAEPTVSLRPPLVGNPGATSKFFYNCPDNAFQIAMAGRSYTLLQRVGAYARNGIKLFAVGSTASLIGTSVSNALIKARHVVIVKTDSTGGEVKKPRKIPILATTFWYGVYMALSSNLRYQIVAGVIEQRLLEPLLHHHKPALKAMCFAVRTGNTFLGSCMWVDYAKKLRLQQA